MGKLGQLFGPLLTSRLDLISHTLYFSPRPDFLNDLFLPCTVGVFVSHLKPSLEGGRYTNTFVGKYGNLLLFRITHTLVIQLTAH